MTPSRPNWATLRERVTDLEGEVAHLHRQIERAREAGRRDEREVKARTMGGQVLSIFIGGGPMTTCAQHGGRVLDSEAIATLHGASICIVFVLRADMQSPPRPATGIRAGASELARCLGLGAGSPRR